MFLLRHLQHAQHARNTDRATAAARRRHGCGRVRIGLILPCKIVARGRCGRGFAAIVGHDFLGRRVVVHHERTACNRARLRLHQAKHGLHRHRRIDGRSARLQHLATGLAGQRRVRHRHVAVRLLGLEPQAVARSRFRRGRITRHARAHDHRAARAAQHRATVGVGVHAQRVFIIVVIAAVAAHQKHRNGHRGEWPEFSCLHGLSPLVVEVVPFAEQPTQIDSFSQARTGHSQSTLSAATRPRAWCFA